VSAKDLAVMGATLADGGVNPITKERVIDPATCHYTLAVMATAGLYETSGDWLFDIGLPGKSGIGRGIATVSAGKGGFVDVRSTLPETASRDSSSPSSCRSAWEWISSCHGPRTDHCLLPIIPAEGRMAMQSTLGTSPTAAERTSWVPMIAIALGQMIMSFNV